MSKHSKRQVVWDEQNLSENAEYQRTHPVTMHIDEPKTPYVHLDDDVEDDEDEHGKKWDPTINAYVKEAKERVLSEKTGPAAPVKGGRPMLAPGTTDGRLGQEQHDRQFKSLRKAVYADEGAKFKALLAQNSDNDDEDNDNGYDY
ncbi:hypothetical protein AGDE_01722 [Angomonas deanei]|uniref:Protein phosphatase inhibitor 2 (IPP-2), putative n=1 Tax=Angomonas deanei TaxID=59799 RepID=S9VCH5_9TRYP|nr:hypothetical protein AGDE_05381 [Angomonas deanei]EPY42201.1 hypothetical protein AGDE_01722 [Angomonas deanei]CAD2213434.1 Protein phosphatase inhibitor 2 (IPP-2), putative [Angomonas deanei]|eukprot:EPY38548.1 hypothetical protein AGDE_05381 [Angomonas deanei]